MAPLYNKLNVTRILHNGTNTIITRKADKMKETISRSISISIVAWVTGIRRPGPSHPMAKKGSPTWIGLAIFPYIVSESLQETIRNKWKTNNESTVDTFLIFLNMSIM